MISSSNKKYKYKTFFYNFKTFLKKYYSFRKNKSTKHKSKTNAKSKSPISNKASSVSPYRKSPPPSVPILAKYIRKSSPKSPTKSYDKKSPVYSSKNKLFNNLVLFYAKLFAKELPDYVIFNQNEDSYTFALTSNTGIQKKFKFKNLDDFLTSFHKIINIFITTCKIPFLCRPKTIKLLKNINELYINYYNNLSDLYNIYNLIINIYTLINRIALENLDKKDKKFVFINKCRLLLEIYLPESNVKSSDL